MKALYLTLAVVPLLCLTAAADEKKDKIDKDKLIGTWEAVKGSESLPLGATLEFTKDGKMKIVIKGKEDKTLVITGTWKLTGDALKTTLKADDKEHTETIKITKLTDKDLVIVDEKDKKDVLKKKK